MKRFIFLVVFYYLRCTYLFADPPLWLEPERLVGIDRPPLAEEDS